jgi:hypothetical protein
VYREERIFSTFVRRTLSDLHANYEEVVESYLSVMSDTFLENTEFQLVDNTESEDYDIFCAYIAEKASRLSRFKFLSMVESTRISLQLYPR